jgi:polysaccharide export outer membrane protein
LVRVFWIVGLALLASGCGWLDVGPSTSGRPPTEAVAAAEGEGSAKEPATDYVLGPGDRIQVFVWRNPELSTTIPIRPDGKITIPLVEDMIAAGKRPTELARSIEQALSAFIEDPIVSVIAMEFGGEFDQQIRVIGEATRPQAIAFKARMTVLDVMIHVGGLTQFAAGNRSVIVRRFGGADTTIPVNLSDLLRDGRLENNVPVKPGDVIIIPQSLF